MKGLTDHALFVVW